ncbi:mitogen-activated protein kinase kinase kinase 18 [Iris pallida]|uniref:Mitogen-activated protein kinase kinase kinase 18 n=1 Tax=Iris pallida TaxID=29817 RepID=A0AAX6I114_IRIPA|nr:mitogen-activated protein kinase kinase kinase 18 [Iris pallida]
METMGWTRGRCIGNGSFGTVSLAYRGAAGPFAVKSVCLNSPHPAAVSVSAAVASLEKEIRILRSLSSPYVVAYLGDSTTRESSSVWRNLHMECLLGGTLLDCAATASRLREPDIRAYARCVARALHYLHSVAGVVHSDVKGRNVLLGPAPGSAKLADFGSARRMGDDERNGRVCVCVGGGGTPLWMAPEVARGERAVPESDVWSLGCTVIEMATGGGQPWGDRLERCGQPQLMFLIGYGSELPEFPSRLSEIGRDFLDKCLRRDAAERWSAGQLLQHPFLAEADCVDADTHVRLSPRSILDCEFDDGGYEEEEEHEEEGEEAMENARERIRDVARGDNEGGIVSWDTDDDDWEVVRSTSVASSLVLDMTQTLQNISEQCQAPCTNCVVSCWCQCSVGVAYQVDWDGDGDGDGKGESGSGLSNGIATSCTYHGCKLSFGCQHECRCMVGVYFNKKLFLFFI